MKKLICLFVTILMVFSLVACQSSDNQEAGGTEKSAQSALPEFLETDDGIIRCVGIEKANAGLAKEENAWVVKFEFTNKKAEPEQCQNQFKMSFFQNNVEVDDISSYSSDGGDHYKLLGNFFKETMNGGTVTFGKGVVLIDSSPVTIFMKTNGSAEEKTASVILEVGGEEPKGAAGGEAVDAATVREAVQGKWDIKGTNEVSFTGDAISFDGIMNGTFTVNTDEMVLDAKLQATDGVVSVKLPYQYENGTLKLFNNQGDELTKK